MQGRDFLGSAQIRLFYFLYSWQLSGLLTGREHLLALHLAVCWASNIVLRLGDECQGVVRGVVRRVGGGNQLQILKCDIYPPFVNKGKYETGWQLCHHSLNYVEEEIILF